MSGFCYNLQWWGWLCNAMYANYKGYNRIAEQYSHDFAYAS